MLQCDVLIIGAGASGLMCAIESAKRGRKTFVLDHRAKAAEKVRISGGGQCNFSNRHIRPDCYISINPRFVHSALARFSTENLIALLKTHRIPFEEREEGQLFCRTKASVLVDTLIQMASNAGVHFLFGQQVRKVEKKEKFLIAASGQTIQTSTLVVATGGLSYPQLGATDFGFQIARQFGIPIIPPEPALTPMLWRAEDVLRYGSLSGVSLQSTVRVGKQTISGSLLFTHEGLSGPAILQASLYRCNRDPLIIDLLPGQSLKLCIQTGRDGKLSIGGLLNRLLPQRLAKVIANDIGLQTRVNQLNKKTEEELIRRVHQWEVLPGEWDGYSKAEVTRGGVDTRAISSKTMECRSVPGLYFIGEVLDVTGRLGGYNLHWAWASGFTAGQFV